MSVRKIIREASQEVLAAPTAAALQTAVIDNFHILPTQVISCVFNKLPYVAMCMLAPYIPRKLWQAIPVEYMSSPELAPLILSRPHKRLWGDNAALRDVPDWILVHYRLAYLAPFQHRAGVLRYDEHLLRTAVFYLPVRQLNQLLRAALADDRLLKIITPMLRFSPFSVADSRLMLQVLTKLRADMGFGWSQRIFISMLPDKAHYRVMQGVLRMFVSSNEPVHRTVAAKIRDDLRAGRLYCRLPAALRLQLAMRLLGAERRVDDWLLGEEFLSPLDAARLRVCGKLLRV